MYRVEEIEAVMERYDIEQKGYLNRDESSCFWYSTGILGWNLDEVVKKDNVKDLYEKSLDLHRKICPIIEKSSSSELISKLNLKMTENEIDAIKQHLFY